MEPDRGEAPEIGVVQDAPQFDAAAAALAGGGAAEVPSTAAAKPAGTVAPRKGGRKRIYATPEEKRQARKDREAKKRAREKQSVGASPAPSVVDFTAADLNPGGSQSSLSGTIQGPPPPQLNQPDPALVAFLTPHAGRFFAIVTKMIARARNDPNAVATPEEKEAVGESLAVVIAVYAPMVAQNAPLMALLAALGFYGLRVFGDDIGPAGLEQGV